MRVTKRTEDCSRGTEVSACALVDAEENVCARLLVLAL